MAGGHRWLVPRLAVLTALGLAASSCGGGGADEAVVVTAAAPRQAADDAAVAPTVAALNGFGARLFLEAAPPDGNALLSPWSVATALAMTRNGARGATAAEMDAVLGVPVEVLNAGMNALDQTMAARSGTRQRGDGSTADVAWSAANALWGQDGTTFEPAFLDVLAASYGAGMRTVDYRSDAEGARRAINAWVSEQTRTKIPDLIAQGVLDAFTRLVLVNAVYLKAPWEQPFHEEATADLPFTTDAGTEVPVPTMRIGGRLPYARGDGWQSVRLDYAGRELAMTLLVPDAGRLADVAGGLPNVLPAALATEYGPTVTLGLPRFRFRTPSALRAALSTLGMPTAFVDGEADLSGITTDEPLHVAAVVHEAFVAVDEEGTEAAAATAVAAAGASAPIEVVELVIDRPFLFAIHDVGTGLVLFLGRVGDPSATTE
jgi:serpin B